MAAKERQAGDGQIVDGIASNRFPRRTSDLVVRDVRSVKNGIGHRRLRKQTFPRPPLDSPRDDVRASDRAIYA